MDRYTELKNKMSMHAQAEYPREVCGIITKDYTYIPCKNISPTPSNSFILDPVALYEYDTNIWGIFHSHPGDENPLPSEEDMSSAIFDEYKFIVGFGSKFYIYWLDKNIEILRYEEFTENHLNEKSQG